MGQLVPLQQGGGPAAAAAAAVGAGDGGLYLLDDETGLLRTTSTVKKYVDTSKQNKTFVNKHTRGETK
jgi:hypothetical protein